jgi:hypothetical protein
LQQAVKEAGAGAHVDRKRAEAIKQETKPPKPSSKQTASNPSTSQAQDKPQDAKAAWLARLAVLRREVEALLAEDFSTLSTDDQAAVANEFSVIVGLFERLQDSVAFDDGLEL